MSNNSNTNTQTSNDILNPFIEGITLAQSIAVSLVDIYSEFFRTVVQHILEFTDHNRKTCKR